MRRTLFLLAGLALATAAAAAPPPVIPERIVAAAKARVEAGVYPAMVVVMVDGRRSRIAGFGRLADGRAPDADTVFEIGSVTKTLTALLLAREVEAGRLRLDTPVASLLPDWTIPARDGKAITLGELATQHSGLPRLPGNLMPKDLGNPYADYGVASLRTFLAGYALPRDPGAAYEYSNLGFGLLAQALAAHAGHSYRELLRSQVFAPLHMDASDTRLTPAVRAHLADGHDEAGGSAAHWDFNALAGAGGVLSSGRDMLAYLRAVMGENGPARMRAAMRLAQQPRRDIGHGDRIGLAWMSSGRGEDTVIWHNGITGGYASFVGFDPAHHRGVAILVNAPDAPEELGFAALRDDVPLTPVGSGKTLSPQALDAYTGRYRLAPGVELNVQRREDRLFAQATGQGAFPLYASGDDRFVARVGGIAVDFQRGADGRVRGLVLHQHGDHVAPRVGDATPSPRPVRLDAATLQDYVGRYRLAPGVLFEVERRGTQLYVQLTGQAALPVQASARDAFFYAGVDAQLRFERDASGTVDALVLHQNGVDQRAPRIAP